MAEATKLTLVPVISKIEPLRHTAPWRASRRPNQNRLLNASGETGVAFLLLQPRASTGKTAMDIEDEKTPLEKMGIIIPEEFVGLFADPPLLEGEDPTAYWNWVAAMIKDREPQGFLEWTYVSDMVIKLWEERRFRRASTGLMRGEMFSALMYFLRQIHADGQEPEQAEQTFSLEVNPPRKLSAAEKLAFKYFSKDPKEKQQVTSLLARYGITPAVLQAKAAQQNSDAIQMFEAMTARRGRERRKLRQEDDRLRRRRDSAKGSDKE